MSALSKYFDQAIVGATCRELLHPASSCGQFARRNLLGTVGSNVRFFLPISVLRLLLLVYNRRALNRAILAQTGREFGAMMVNALLVANCWTGMFCVLSRTTGRIHDNYSVSLAPFLGALAMFVMPAYVQSTHAKAIFIADLECWIKSRENTLIEWMRDSRTVGTLCFMLVSAGIARYGRQIRHRAEFWFFTPLRPQKPEDVKAPKVCYHREGCTRYVLTGMRTFFTFGAILELARRLIVTVGKLHQTTALERVRSLLRLRYRLILFLTLYNGSFRLVNCLLARQRSRVRETDDMVAGFTAGFWYFLSPSYNIFNLAVSALAQTYWNFLVEKHASVPVVQRLDRVSFASIVWVASMCYVTYSRAYYPWAMSKFAHKFIDLCSNYASRTASENFARRFLVANQVE
ncbi:uncharacterized protein LOC131291101 [Anopheles ziemanni]|uniref:uncharacterized protein LOC131269310 n=1 Tax=Anopheles coustani TaxID=139045 RepID=UPI00265B050D|nr:uncharacterized protein LOC131269310 [Anopheles coustani]XP_058176275.1 uncharacterized protein LOC131291101 [Anopheles ziemanni]